MALANSLDSAQTLAPTSSVQFASLAVNGNLTAGSPFSVATNSSQYMAANITGTLSAVDGGPLQYGLYLNNIFSPTSGASFSFQVYSNPTIAIPSGQFSSFADFLASPQFTGNLGTLNNYYGFRFDGGGSLPAGTITNSYGAFIAHPTATATTSIALYCEDLAIGGVGTRPPTNGFFSIGSGVVGDSVANGKSILTVTSTTQGFLPPRLTTTQKNAISGPPAGLTVYDSTLSDLQFYNGATWIGTTSSGVTAIVGTASQVLANGTSGSSQTGSVTLTLPQSIATTSTVQFGKAIIGTSSGTTMTLQLLGAAGDAYSLYTQRLTTFLDGSSFAYSVGLYDTISPVGSYTSGFAIFNQTGFAARNAQTATNSYSYYSAPIYNLNVGTITNVYNMYLQAGTASAGTITNAWGLVVEIPTAGATTNTCAAFTGTTVIGATAPDSKAILTITSTTLGFLPPRMTTTQKNAISSPTSGLVVYDSTLNDLQFYNGAAWVTGGGVFSITGTANQITASASAGAVTLSVPSDFRPPGTLALGGGPQSNTTLTVSATGQYSEYITGTLATAGVDHASLYVNNVSSPGTSFKSYGVRVGTSFTNPGSGTLVDAAAFYADPTFTGSGTTTSGYGLLVSVGTSSTTVTTGYGIKVNALAFGTTRYGLYVTAPSGGSTNNTAYFDVGVGIGAANASGTGNATAFKVTATSAYNTWIAGVQTSDDGTNAIGLLVVPTYNPTSTSRSALNIYAVPVFKAVAAQTIDQATNLFINNTFTGNAGTVTTVYGILVTAGGALVGTVTNHYGLYVSAPTAGTNRYTAYFDQGVGIGTTNALSANVGFLSSATGQYNIQLGGTLATASANLFSLAVQNTLSPSTGLNAYGVYSAPTFNSGSGGLSSGQALYAYPQMTGSGTITEIRGLYIDTGSVTGTTVGTGYGIRVSSIAYGTTRYGLYVDTPTGGSNNYGAFLGGVVGISRAADANVQLGITVNRNYGIYMDGNITGISQNLFIMRVDTTMTPASNSFNAYAMIITPAVVSGGSGVGNVFGVITSTAFSGSGTTTAYNGFYADTGSTSGVTVTTATQLRIQPLAFGTTRYGIYCSAQSGGSTNICAYFGGPIEIGVSSTGSTTALLATGNCPATTGTSPYVWMTFISSDGSTVYVPAWK